MGKISPYPIQVSFIEPGHGLELARSFPCVFQQLPSLEFMQYFGEASGLGVPRSVIFDLDPEETKAVLSRNNPTLFDRAQDWRKAHLKDDSFGVRHYLIGAVCSAESDRKHSTDMRMAQPDNRKEDGDDGLGEDPRQGEQGLVLGIGPNRHDPAKQEYPGLRSQLCRGRIGTRMGRRYGPPLERDGWRRVEAGLPAG